MRMVRRVALEEEIQRSHERALRDTARAKLDTAMRSSIATSFT
jgi:hypothetical protein